MPRRASAKRYAQAIFELATERGETDQWAEGLQVMNEALQEPQFRAFLEHAKIPLPRKVRTIGEALQGADPFVRNLLSLLVSRGLLDLVPEVQGVYQQLLDKYKGREQVEVYSAVPLEDRERERIIRLLGDLTKTEVVLDSRVDPSILGGLVIKIGDKLMDGSTRTRLAQLGKQLQRGSAAVEA